MAATQQTDKHLVVTQIPLLWRETVLFTSCLSQSRKWGLFSELLCPQESSCDSRRSFPGGKLEPTKQLHWPQTHLGNSLWAWADSQGEIVSEAGSKNNNNLLLLKVFPEFSVLLRYLSDMLLICLGCSFDNRELCFIACFDNLNSLIAKNPACILSLLSMPG